MPASHRKRLSVVSRVTIHVFLIQLLLSAALTMWSPGDPLQAFAHALMTFAVIQAILALSVKQRPAAGSFTEWDGVSWLMLIATGCLILAR